MEPAAPGRTRVGFIGTGVMGAPMARHVLDAGYALCVHNRTRAKADALVAAGAAWCASAADVAAASDVVFTMVGFPADVRGVLAGAAGVLARLPPGGVVVDLTTSEPALAEEMAAAAAAQGRTVLDAPVTGGDKGAAAGTLSVMVGGDAAAVAAVMPLLQCFAKTVAHFGGPGMGQHAKAANQITIASQMVGLAEGLVYAQSAGLDLDRYIGAIAGGGAGGKTIELYAYRTLAGDFQPGFFVEHFIKDLGIALESCRKMSVSLPGLALAAQLYNSLAAHGEDRLGTQALVKVLERMNNVKLDTPANAAQ